MAQPQPPPYPTGGYEQPPPYVGPGPAYNAGPHSDYTPKAPPAQHGNWGPPPPPPGGYYGSTVVIEPVSVPAQIIIVGNCPACRVGILQDCFSCLGLFCAIFFFPIGVLCCLAMRDKRCNNCGATF